MGAGGVAYSSVRGATHAHRKRKPDRIAVSGFLFCWALVLRGGLVLAATPRRAHVVFILVALQH